MPRLLRCLLLMFAPGLALAQYGYPGGIIQDGPVDRVPDAATPLVVMRGALRRIDKKKIAIDASEDQILTFKRSKKTKFLKGTKPVRPDDFPEGAAVVIEASRVMNGDYDAVNVFLGEPPAPPKPATAAPPAQSVPK